MKLAASSTHNGDQERVRAAAKGSTVEEIASATGLDAHAVRVALTRLRDAGLVQVHDKRRGATRYTATPKKPLLADLWK